MGKLRAQTEQFIPDAPYEQSLNNVNSSPDKQSSVSELPCINSDENSEERKFSNVSVFGTVFNQKVKMLVDTGAALTVISKQFFEEVLSPTYVLQPNKIIDNIKTADGSITPVSGFVSFQVKIGIHDYTCSASVVPNLAYEIVLGRDFLHNSSAVIDVKGRSVTFSNSNKVSFVDEDRSPIVSEVRISRTFVIDCGSEVIVPAYLSNPSDIVDGIIEPNEKLSDRYKLCGAPTLSRPNEDFQVSFGMLNPSDSPVILHKGTAIGNFTEVNCVNDIASFELHDPAVSSLQQSNVNSGSFSSAFKCLPSPNLSSEENTKLNSLLEEYSDVFATSNLDLGRTSIIQHKIDTGDANPIKQAPYRTSQSQRQDIENHISNMLEQDVIQISTSPWSSPVVLVKKKEGTTRFCIDYRKLNAVTKKDSYPLPRIDDALDSLAGSKYFSTLDLQSGYHQVAMHPDSMEKTAFISHAGLFEYKVMSFGLTNAPPSFQRLMTRVLHGLNWKICLVYIDDVIIFSKTFEEQLSRLAAVFQRFREAKLKLKPSKCHFAQESVSFLGFVVNRAGILPDPTKLDAVKSFPTPKTIKEVRSFLGLCNYYRRFVENFAKIASPLNLLTRKDVTFDWDSSCQNAFNELKARLCTPPYLHTLISVNPFIFTLTQVSLH